MFVLCIVRWVNIGWKTWTGEWDGKDSAVSVWYIPRSLWSPRCKCAETGWRIISLFCTAVLSTTLKWLLLVVLYMPFAPSKNGTFEILDWIIFIASRASKRITFFEILKSKNVRFKSIEGFKAAHSPNLSPASKHLWCHNSFFVIMMLVKCASPQFPPISFKWIYVCYKKYMLVYIELCNIYIRILYIKLFKIFLLRSCPNTKAKGGRGLFNLLWRH